MKKNNSKEEKKKKHSSNWKKIALTLAIAIIFVLFAGFGIEAFYDSPDYEDYCDYSRERQVVEDRVTCEANGGIWENYPEAKIPVNTDEDFACRKIDEEDGELTLRCTSQVSEGENGWCDYYGECGEEYKDVSDIYNRNVFIICSMIGVISIFLGVTLRKESVGTGVLIGGVLTVLYGTIRYWSELGNIIRFLLLGVVLALLIYLGYKKIKD